MTGFSITCPMCGGAVTPWGWTAAGNQTGQCAHCYESVIVTAHASYGAGRINRDAPFFALVELVDDYVEQRKAANTRAVACADTPSGAGAAQTARPPAKHNGGA